MECNEILIGPFIKREIKARGIRESFIARKLGMQPSILNRMLKGDMKVSVFIEVMHLLKLDYNSFLAQVCFELNNIKK